MNAGTRLQTEWRWNGRPLRIRIQHTVFDENSYWHIDWSRWYPKARAWRIWRSYRGRGELRDVIVDYREYAAGWRGLEDQ